VTLKPIFRANPYLAHAAKFNGVFGKSSRSGARGFYAIAVTNTGMFTGTISYGGRTETIKGQLLSNGALTLRIARPGLRDLFVYLDYTLDPFVALSVGLQDGDFNFAGLSFPNFIPTGLGSKYTASFQTNANKPGLPRGFGYLTATHDGKGAFRMAGALADGTPFTAGASVDGEGQIPFFAALDIQGSSVGGLLNLDSNQFPAAAGLAGTVFWNHLSNPKALVFKSAFTASLQAAGQRYTPPTGSNLVNPFTLNQSVAFSARELANPAHPTTLTTVTFNLGASYRLSNLSNLTAKLGLTFTPSSGMFSGSFMEGTPSKKHTFNGVIVKGTGGFGFFYDAAKNGQVTLSP
jgi:hypothetical protein